MMKVVVIATAATALTAFIVINISTASTNINL